MTCMAQNVAGMVVPAVEVPVPTRVTVVGEFPAVLVTVSAPVAAPAAVGVNVTLSVRFWLAFNVTGRVTPVDANGPEIVNPLTVIEPELLFVTVTVWAVLALPTVTLPRFKLVGATVRLRESCIRLELELPPQAASSTPRRITSAKDQIVFFNIYAAEVLSSSSEFSANLPHLVGLGADETAV